MIKINPNIDILIADTVINRVNNLNTKYSNLSIYKTPIDRDYQCQDIFSKRYEEVYNSVADKLTINELYNPLTILKLFNEIKQFENQGENSQIITNLSIRAIKEEFNLADDEILFDVKIVNDPAQCTPKDDDCEFIIEEPEDRPDVIEDELLKRYLVNAIVTGSGMRGMNIFNMFSNAINRLNPEISDIYRKASALNELIVFCAPDEIFTKACENDSAGSFMKIEFEGDTPKIIIRAINLITLCHELYKSVVYITSMYSLDEDSNKAKLIMNYCDVVENEPMEFRFGPYFWSTIHSLIPIDDHDIKKNILIKIFSLDIDDFISFMKDICHHEETNSAKNQISDFIREIRKEIADYEIEKDFDIDNIGLSELGF